MQLWMPVISGKTETCRRKVYVYIVFKPTIVVILIFDIKYLTKVKFWDFH